MWVQRMNEAADKIALKSTYLTYHLHMARWKFCNQKWNLKNMSDRLRGAPALRLCFHNEEERRRTKKNRACAEPRFAWLWRHRPVLVVPSSRKPGCDWYCQLASKESDGVFSIGKQSGIWSHDRPERILNVLLSPWTHQKQRDISRWESPYQWRFLYCFAILH